MDPRFSIHNVTVQQVPPSVPNPKKRLAHNVKYGSPSQKSNGTFQGIPRRAGLLRGLAGAAAEAQRRERRVKL